MMLYTLTANPAIDMNFLSQTSDLNKVNRTSDIVYSPNGKGINVSLTLKYFGIDSTVLGFFGGFTGRYIVDELKKREIVVRPCWIEENTRINTFITVPDGEYKFVNKGPFINLGVQQELLEELRYAIDCETLVISGSLPPSIDESYYDEIIKFCQAQDIEVVLDISSKKLKDLLKYRPKLIKPNDEELADIFGLTLETENDIKEALTFLYQEGAQNILLTLGERGIYFFNGEKMYFCEAKPVKLVSSACAGDACLAAFLSEWKTNVELALKKGSAVGANVAQSYGLGDFNEYKAYMKEINVTQILVGPPC